MRFLSLTALAALALALSLAPGSSAQSIEPTPGITFPLAGKIRARAASEIKASSWSIGGETLDRNFADYHQYKNYLGPLGAKAIRLQAGWARIEREPGSYDWAWLDAIIDDALSQGVQPWLNLSYGNTLYPGGGDITLAAGLPTSPEALAAWNRWTRATVQRYRTRVTAWEIWNEPDLSGKTPADQYLALFIPTAEMIRAEQPEGRIYALGLAGNAGFASQFLKSLQTQNKLGLVDAITVHGYPQNPSETASFGRWRELVAQFSDKIQVRQGESGAPSFRVDKFALKNIDWTELTQAKWDLCRLVTHLAHDMPMNLFTLCDLHYVGTRHNGPNPKGLLKANPDNTVAYAKPAYAAAQNVFAIFDSTWSALPSAKFTVADPALAKRLSLYALTTEAGTRGIVVWFGDKPPAADNTPTPVTLSLVGARFSTPVLVDLRTGIVYDLPAETWKQNAASVTFTALPVYDAPVLITEKSALPLVK